MRALLHLLTELLIGVVAPDGCAACDEPVPMRTIFCRPCARTVEPGDGAFVYGGALAVALTRFKYERRPDLARPLAEILKHVTQGMVVDLVAPVPLHPTRLSQRGFDQAALLARPVARQLGVRFEPRALVRRRDTPQQAHLDREARAANVCGAFQAKGFVRGQRVLLVDDVRTTGSTLDACAEALRAAGALDVRWAVVAQA